MYHTNELMYKTKIDPQTWKQTYVLTDIENKLGINRYTTVYTIDQQPGTRGSTGNSGQYLIISMHMSKIATSQLSRDMINWKRSRKLGIWTGPGQLVQLSCRKVWKPMKTPETGPWAKSWGEMEAIYLLVWKIFSIYKLQGCSSVYWQNMRPTYIENPFFPSTHTHKHTHFSHGPWSLRGEKSR